MAEENSGGDIELQSLHPEENERKTAEKPPFSALLQPEYQFYGQTIALMIISFLLAITGGQFLFYGGGLVFFFLTVGFALTSTICSLVLLFVRALNEACYRNMYPLGIILFCFAAISWCLGLVMSLKPEKFTVDIWVSVVSCGVLVLTFVIVLFAKMLLYFSDSNLRRRSYRRL